MHVARVLHIKLNTSAAVKRDMYSFGNFIFDVFFFYPCCLVEEWLRPLLRQDKQVLVHWWYYPDRFVNLAQCVF